MLDLQPLGLPAVTEQQPLSGGSISQAWRVKFSDGRVAFVKQHSRAPAHFFAAEAQGLACIAAQHCVPTPGVWAFDETHLVLDWIESSPRQAGFDERLGAQLAALHGNTRDQFGFDEDNFCGLTPQPNPWTEDGHAFFADARLRYQGHLARDRGLLPGDDMQRLERLCGRLTSLIPTQPAALIHGDLWSGNVISASQGEPVLIDPAVHFGWAEAELAMTRLFGGFGPDFYHAYAEHSPTLATDWQERVPLYNLYHLLNHLNLFGRGYLGPVQAVLRRFG